MCVKGVGELARSSIMAFSSIQPCLDSSFIFFLMSRPLILPFTHLSCCHKGRELTSYPLLPYNNLQICFFSPKITGFPCTFLILCFFFSFHFILPPPPATPSVHQKFTFPDSTNPFERPEERKYSKNMYCSSYP